MILSRGTLLKCDFLRWRVQCGEPVKVLVNKSGFPGISKLEVVSGVVRQCQQRLRGIGLELDNSGLGSVCLAEGGSGSYFPNDGDDFGGKHGSEHKAHILRCRGGMYSEVPEDDVGAGRHWKFDWCISLMCELRECCESV